jgi:hypothetical protein
MIANGFVRALGCFPSRPLNWVSQRLCMLLIATFTWGVSATADAQTQMPLPAQTGTFSGNSRGYWFTSPTNFVITGVQVPTDANIAVLRLTAAPPVFSATTDAFTQLFLAQNNASAGVLPTRIAVSQNDVIGVLGDRGSVNSYASGAPHASTIDSQPVSLGRLGMQFPLATTAPQQVWQETGGSISRVFLEYEAGFLISAAASPPAGGSVTCTPDIVASGMTTTCTVTANPGYAVSTVSGCGVTATAPPYTTAPASAHCTVTANFAPGVTVGGTVGGLSGTGLALSLNGTETLPIAADGTFTFASTVGTGSPYNVTVQTQPSAPSQTCTVANASGTAGASNITDVTVTCTTNTYTVGGNVSGLSGSGLVLSLNSGAQTFNVSANGSFVFPTALASGSAYAVTVQTQPSAPTQTCTVGSGSGTVTNANVSDVSVTCSTDTYTVGGSVSGLTGSGFVLSLNSGAQTLAIGADGGFTFPTAIASGSAYTVSVQTQPSAPAQTCSVSNGTGTIANSNVTNVAVQCALQQRVVSLSSTFGTISTSPPIPSSVADGTVLSFTLNVPAGYTLLGASGCGGTLSGTTYTTAPITADCAISVNLAAAVAEVVPTLNGVSLVVLSMLLLGIAASNRRRTR